MSILIEDHRSSGGPAVILPFGHQLLKSIRMRTTSPPRRRVGTALIDRDLLRQTMMTNRLTQETPRSLTIRLAVSRKSTVASALSTARYKCFQTLDPPICLVPSPTGTHWILARAKAPPQHRTGFVTWLNTWPIVSPVNASPQTSRSGTHDSGSMWLAPPSS
jgi:hypothetical protein